MREGKTKIAKIGDRLWRNWGLTTFLSMLTPNALLICCAIREPPFFGNQIKLHAPMWRYVPAYIAANIPSDWVMV
jgi:hypothetical protein